MRTVTSLCLIALLAAVCAPTMVAQQSASKSEAKPAKAQGAGLQATLEKLEKQGWEAFKNKDAKAYSALCAPEYTAIFADGKPPHDLNSALDAMKQITMNSYNLSDLKATALGPKTALVTYTATTNLTSEGKTQDYQLAVTDVLVKHGGQWKSLRYHESEIK